MDAYIDVVLKVLKSTSLQKYFCVFEMSVKAVLSTDLSIRVRLMYEAQVVPAYASVE